MNRYLTKLCDQLVCLLSDEHSQAIVWGDEADDRVYDFLVAKTNEQEESVTARLGFTVRCFIAGASPRINIILRSS